MFLKHQNRTRYDKKTIIHQFVLLKKFNLPVVITQTNSHTNILDYNQRERDYYSTNL